MADPNHAAQVAEAQKVAERFAGAKDPGSAKALAKQLKTLLDAIVWDD